MNGRPLITRALSVLLAAAALALMAVAPAFAQSPPAGTQDQAARPSSPTPVMQNVFYNVVWGSAVGALIGVAAAVEGSTDKSNPANVRGSAFEGATIGGVVGIGVAVWLVYAGITFDPQGSTIIDAASPGDPVAFEPRDLRPAPGERPQPAAAVASAGFLPPFSLETAPGQPGKITGFRARILDLRF